MNALNAKISAVLLAVLCVGAPNVRAQDAKAPQLSSLEQQIDYVVGALSESLRSMDYKMICMAADGFKAAGLTGKDLEIAVLRAERDAALSGGFMMGGNNAQIPVLGQVARGKAGDAKAVETLRGWAFTELTPVKAPDFSQFKDKPAEVLAAQKASQEYAQNVQRKQYAFLGLALLKEPGIAEKAIAALRSAAESNQGVPVMGGGRTDILALAALTADPKAGIKGLIDLCSDDKAPIQAQVAAIGMLTRLAPGTKSNKGADAPFSLEGDVSAELPQDTLAQCSKVYVAVMKRWTPDPKQPNDPSINQLIQTGYGFPAKTIDADGIAAILAARDRITGPSAQWLKPQVDQVLKQQGVDPNTAQKPPAPPKDF